MFGIGLPEMILIMALALIVVGPDKLPELARSIAKGVLELKKTVSSLKEDFAEENPFDSVKPELEEVASSLKNRLGDASPDGWDGIIDADGETSPADDTATDKELIDDDSVDSNGHAVITSEAANEPEQAEDMEDDIDAVSGKQELDEQPSPTKPGETPS